MPTGFTDSLTPVARLIEWLQPETVLDIGIGNGRMGFLAREYGHQPWHPRARGHGVRIDGIEGHEPYIRDLQEAIYDRIMVGNALDVLATLRSEHARYQLAIAAGIIEHFEPDDAKRFLDHCLAVTELLLVATPHTYFAQEDPENPLETHRSHWPEQALLRAGARTILHRGESLIALFGDSVLTAEYLAARRPRLREWLLPPALLTKAYEARARRQARAADR